MGSFARSPHDMARNFWNLPQEKRDMPEKLQGEESHGLFDIRNFDHMDAVISAGLGGGSLIYANVFLQPPDEVFDHNWPANAKKTCCNPIMLLPNKYWAHGPFHKMTIRDAKLSAPVYFKTSPKPMAMNPNCWISTYFW